MGGSGSGQWHRWNSKATTESQHRIDIRWLNRQGYLRSGYTSSLRWLMGHKQTGFIEYKVEADCMILYYRYRINGGEWKSVEQSISFDRTPCNFGGYRKWFLCTNCSKRVAILYGAGKLFLCRHCYNLTYSSQQECREYRLLRKARNIRLRLDGSNNMFDPFPWKPKNMHWKTYWQLRHKAELAYSFSLSMAAKHLGLDF